MKRHLFACIIGIIGVLAFSFYIIGNFTSYYYAAESVQLDAINAFFRNSWQFLPVPHLNLVSDWFLYPYGIDLTFMPYYWENNYMQMLWHLVTGRMFPNQWYYIYSLLITYFGVYALVSRRKGVVWGCFFAFVMTFCNYAAICKFPGHDPLCAVHWLAVSFVLDLILVEKIWNHERFSAQFIQCRVLVWLLGLGMGLGYVVGMIFTISLFSIVYVGIILCLRERSIVGCWRFAMRSLMDFRDTYRASLVINALLTVLILMVSWLFLPLTVQIFLHASSLSEKTQIWQTHLLRLVIPILPGLNPATVPNQGAFAYVDTIYAWNAGWFFPIVFILSLLKGGWRGAQRSLPFILLFVLFLLFYHFPVLSYLPMFKCSRIPERFSPGLIMFLLVPLFLGAKQVSVANSKSFIKQKWELLVLLGGLFVTEFITAYSSTFIWAKELYPLGAFPPEYLAAVDKITKMPGEGLFFMPFSACGGDGKGMTCYHWLTAHQMQFAALCGKKMNGVYLGRMFPELYLKDFNRFGWQDYVESDHGWSSRRWKAFESFLVNSDFCAIVLAKDCISKTLYADLEAHFGTPTCEFKIFKNIYAVMPVPSHLRGRKNRQAICKFQTPVENCVPGDVMTFATERDRIALEDGFSQREPWGVWSGDRCKIRMSLPTGDRCFLKFKVLPFVKMTSTEVLYGNTRLAEWKLRGLNEAEFWLDCSDLPRHEDIELVFANHDAARPCDHDKNNADTRRLGLGFESVEVIVGDGQTKGGK